MDNKQDRLTYEKKILIRSEQVDMTRRLRMSELFRIMEEASIAHTEELGCTRDRTLDRGLLWIITRQQAEIEELPAYDEEITVRSWQGDMMHVFFPRFYEIERAGRVIVRGQALWMLIDEESRQMVMPEDYDIFIPGRPGSDDMMLAPVVIPSELREESGADGNGRAGAGIVIRQDLMIIVQDDTLKFVFGHQLNTEGIAEHIRIAGIVDMAVDIQVGIDRMVLGDEFLALEVTDRSGKVHRDRKILVVRDELADIARREHLAGPDIQEEPKGAGFADHLPVFVGKDIVAGEETDPGRGPEGMDGDLLAGDRIAVHAELAAGEDPDHVVFDQLVPAAAEEHAVHAGGILHGFEDGARAPFAG